MQITGLTPDLLIQKLVVEPGNLCLMSPPGDSKAGSSVRPTERGGGNTNSVICYFLFFGLLFVLRICEEPISVDCLSTCWFLLAFHSLECSNSYMWSKWTASG